MGRFFIDANGNYFEAIEDIATPDGATPVPQRPQWWSEWTGAAWSTGDEPPPPKRPVSYWALRAALGPTRVAMVDDIIAAMEESETKTLIAEKWAARTGFVSFSHPHTQVMIQAFGAADATFDADALWAVAEGYQAGA